MHANTHSTSTRFRSNGAAAEASGSSVRRWQDDLGGNCSRIAGEPPERKSLVQAMEAWRQRRNARRGSGRPQGEVGPGATAIDRWRTAKGSQGSRLCHRSVDPAPGSCDYRAVDGCPLSPGTCMEDSGNDGLDLAAAGQASPRAESESREALGGE